MREEGILLLLLLPLLVYGDLLSIPSTTFKIPRNAQEGDLIIGPEFIRASEDIDEALNLELEGTNPSPIAINGSIIDAGQPVKFILVNKNAFDSGKSKVKLQAIGVISGKVQEETINFEVEASSDLPSIPEISNFVVKSDFQEKETAIVRVSSPIPPNSELDILGSYAQRVTATFEDDKIILNTVPCHADTPCEVTFPFVVILVLRNGENHVEALLTFQEEKKSSLKMAQKLYQTTIEEHTGEQDHLVKISTKGGSSEVLYSLRDASGLFSIHPKEGILSILHPEFLSISSFGDTVNLTVVATDGDKTADAMINVKIVPEVEKNVVFGFEKESYDITAENINSILGNIKAKSASPVVYRITEGRIDLYKVEPNGDLVYTGKMVKGDREDDVTVVVQQGGLKMASTKVHINLKGIGSNPVSTSDELEKIELISSEDPNGVVVTLIQFQDEDKDAKLTYELTMENGVDENGNMIPLQEQLFEIKSEEKVAHLVVSGNLKTSKITTILLKITARDSTHPKEPSVTVTRLIVIQREKSEEEPMGLNLIPLPTEILVPVDSAVGSFIYKVTVLPMKENLQYSIEPEHLFQILDDGSIVTQKELTVEAEQLKIHVEVSDGSEKKSTETTLTLKKTLHPHFTESRYDVTLPRQTPKDSVITVVSAVGGNGEPVNQFVLKKGGHSKHFKIDEKGALRLADEQERFDDLDDEMDLLVALAENPTISVPVHISLKKNRNPRIDLVENQIFATVYDNLPINSYVGKVEVASKELVKFEMTSDEKGMSSLFGIEEDGTIRSKDWLAGSEGMHKFSVLASNIDQAGVRSANATVVIDVIKSNECSPKFKRDENLIFYVRENTPIDTVIGKVSADVLPGKCALEYSIIGPNSEILSINSANGELKTSKEFDFEKQKSYLLTLKLVAGKYNSVESGAELKILDVDDHEVKFELQEQTVEIPEDAPLNTVVATVKATEGDESQEVFYHLKAGSPPQFSLNSKTGEVMVEQALDREALDNFEIEIGASNSVDLIGTAAMKLLVKVKDVNDNGPTFDRPQYFTVVSKDTVVGAELLELNAYDPDLSDQEKKLEYTVTASSFEYRGMSRNVEDVLDIRGGENPKIYLSKPLTDYVGGVFNVQLQVRDTVDGTIGKSALRVYVHDSSDLLSLELPYSPSTVSQGVIQEFTENLSNSTGLTAIPKSVYYKAPHGIMSTNSIDLQVIFFNKSMSEIVPAERILAMQDMRQDKHQPILRKPASPYLMTSEDPRSDTLIQPELFFMVLGFLVLLAITLALCGMMACFARSRFLREKRIMENEMAIKDAIQFPSNRSPALVSFKHFAPPSAEMYRNHEEHMYRSPNLNEKIGSYAVQQATITVAEHEEKI